MTSNKRNKEIVIDSKDCYVAFIDILGFKKLTEDLTKHDLIKKIFLNLLSARNDLYEVLAKREEDSLFKKAGDGAYIRIMSDSIIIAIPSDIEYSLHFICRCVGYMQSILLREELIARGGISRGLFYGNGELSFGIGLTKAYNLEKSVSVYPRCVIQPEIISDFQNNKEDELKILLDIMSFSNDDYVHIDYVSLAYKVNREQLKDFINVNMEKYEDYLNIRGKYRWLKNEYLRVENLHNKQIEEV